MNIESLEQKQESNSIQELYNDNKLNLTEKNELDITTGHKTKREIVNVINPIKETFLVKEKPSLLETQDLNINKNISIKNTDEEDKQAFIQYRNLYLSQMNDFCNKISQPQYRLSSDNFKDYKTIPKCMMHTSRKICNCKPDCIDSIWRDYKFDESCKIYDLKDINTDDNYVECVYQKIGPPNFEKLLEYPTKEKKEFLNELDELCDNSAFYTSTKCKAYQIRDKCRNDLTCLKKDFNYEKISDCINKEYNDQIMELEKILGIKIKDNIESKDSNSIRKLLSISDDSLFNDTYNKEVIISRSCIPKNELVVISAAGIAIICLLGMFYKRNLQRSTLNTCIVSAVLILFTLILVYITY